MASHVELTRAQHVELTSMLLTASSVTAIGLGVGFLGLCITLTGAHGFVCAVGYVRNRRRG